MAAYALRITPLIHHLLEITSSNKLYSKKIAYADDFTVAASVKDIKCYWEHLNSVAIFFGYYPKASKCHLIVKCNTWKQQMLSFETTKLI